MLIHTHMKLPRFWYMQKKKKNYDFGYYKIVFDLWGQPYAWMFSNFVFRQHATEWFLLSLWLVLFAFHTLPSLCDTEAGCCLYSLPSLPPHPPSLLLYCLGGCKWVHMCAWLLIPPFLPKWPCWLHTSMLHATPISFCPLPVPLSIHSPQTWPHYPPFC